MTDFMLDEDIHRPIRPVTLRWRKFVVVADGTAESELAIRFAAVRASHITGGGLILFRTLQQEGFEHWMAVADRMRQEAMADAQDIMALESEKIVDITGVKPEIVIMEGEPKEELAKYILGRDDIFALVLGAGAAEDPGPLVDYFSREGCTSLGCPIIIIPHSMSLEQIDYMA